MSRHRPVFCSLKCPRICLSDVDISPNRINWKKNDTDMIKQLQAVLENGSSLDSVINAEHADRHSIDASYHTIIKRLKDASEKCFHSKGI